MTQEIKHIVFLIVPDATLLDVTGPLEVFSQAQECLQKEPEKARTAYRLHSVSAGNGKDIRTAAGLTVLCDETIPDIDYPVDTLIVPGVPNSKIGNYSLLQEATGWIAGQAGRVRRLCSVCTGSFFLARAGVLDGKKATTHWARCEALKSDYPAIQVDGNPIFIKDGNIYTSAGISSGMDLALALVEEDLGKSFALEVARQMVLYLKRPGSQSQYSTVLTHQQTDNRPIISICEWIADNLGSDISIEGLAETASMSPRNFARIFVRETGITPARYVEKLRVETACRYLTDSSLSLKEIAAFAGLGSPDNMRKVFVKNLTITPSDYREHFGTAF